MKVGGKAADKLFPFGWFDCSSMEHIKALTEAIDKGITIVETETWNREMVEGLRDKVLPMSRTILIKQGEVEDKA